MQRKIISLGLVLYVLTLLAQPCQDVFARVNETLSHDGANAAVSPGSTPESCTEEGCSPFCICGCCGLSVAHHTFSTIVTFEMAIDLTSTAVTTYRAPYDTTYITTIWQPPKV